MLRTSRGFSATATHPGVNFLCVHVPLDEVTRRMIDARVLAYMERGSYLINVARARR